MDGKKLFGSGSTIRFIKRFLIVPLGTIFLFIFLISLAGSQENHAPGVAEDSQKPVLSKKPGQVEKKLPEEMKKVREWIGRLKDTAEERLRLQNEQNILMDRLSGLKEKNEREDMGPNKVFSRRELEKTAEELHKILEQNRRIAREQKTIMKKLLSNKNQTCDTIGKEMEELRKKIGRAEKNPEAAPERIVQWKENLKDLENLQSILEIFEKNPNALSMLGFGPGASPPSPQPGEWYPGKYAEQKKGDFSPDKGARDRAGMRIFQQMNQLEKQIRFLRNQLERTESNFNELKNTLNKLRERHPEILEELRRENPDRFPENISEPDPDFEGPPRMKPERRRRQEAPQPIQNP